MKPTLKKKLEACWAILKGKGVAFNLDIVGALALDCSSKKYHLDVIKVIKFVDYNTKCAVYSNTSDNGKLDIELGEFILPPLRETAEPTIDYSKYTNKDL